jgi:hypothetical protein
VVILEVLFIEGTAYSWLDVEVKENTQSALVETLNMFFSGV